MALENPEPTTLLYIASLVAVAGSAAAAYTVRLILRIQRLLEDKSLTILALGLTAYAIALLLEAAGNMLLKPEGLPAVGGPGMGRRPAEIAELIVSRGTLLSLPIYNIAYAMMAVSHYVASVRLDEGSQLGGAGRLYAAGVPVIVMVYGDLNLLSLLILVAAAYAVLARYGKAAAGTVAFYTLAGASHLLPVASVLGGSILWWVIPLATILRGSAPLVLLAASLYGRGS